MINFQSQNCEIPDFIDDKTKNWINHVIEYYKFHTGTLNYLFCDDEYILVTNRTYLDHDYYTDIITFDYTVNKVISGDLIISLDTVATNSSQFNTSFKTELLRVVIHGVLHLCGYKDKTEEESTLMRELEDKALNLYSTFE